MSDVGSARAPTGFPDTHASTPPPTTDRRAIDKSLVDMSKDAFGIFTSLTSSFSSVAKIAASVGFWGGRAVNEEFRVINYDASKGSERPPTGELPKPRLPDGERVALQQDTAANFGEATYDLAKDVVDALPLAPGVKHAVALLDVVVESGKVGKAGADVMKTRAEYNRTRRTYERSGQPLTQEQQQHLKQLKTAALATNTKLKTQMVDSGFNIVKDLAKLTPHSTIVDVVAFSGKVGQMAYQNYDPTVGLPKYDPWSQN